MILFAYDASAKTLLCKFSGRMDSVTCSRDALLFEEQLHKIIPAPADGKIAPADLAIGFDLAHVDFVSSAFIRLCFVATKRIRKGGFSISKATPQVSEMLRMAGLDEMLTMDNILHETRVFPPPPAFAEKAHIRSLAEYHRLHKASIADPEAFWAEQARQHLIWMQPWQTVCEWNPPNAKWFAGGQLNVAANCLDRHLGTPLTNKAALIWEGEPAGGGHSGEKRTLTYRQLHHEVCLFANGLKRLGVEPGDRVLLYLPMVPEAAIAMLACARVGAIHSVVFGGFSPQSVAERVADCQAKLLITADGSYRRGAIVPLKKNVDEAMQLKDADGQALCNCIKKVVVLHRADNDVDMEEGRDIWWHQLIKSVSADCPPTPVDSEHPLFILYTSGSTGKPKGIVHSSAGYLLGAMVSHRLVFDLRPEDVYWCTADIGWITGHSYLVYGPLANGATVFMYEGAPNYPEPDRYWRLIETYGVTVFYTAPTAIRAFMKWGSEWPRKYNLSSLRLLGSVGEPINPEAWMWYHEVIGGKRCPIVDTWWQTETGSIMITPLPGAIPAKPGSATLPFLGVDAEVVDESGKPAAVNVSGKLVIRKPWPSMLRGVWGDPRRYQETYWTEVPGAYCTGDGCRRDEDGYLWIVGRLDDVLNVSGHRIGTAEVEGALVSHQAVAEAAVVGRPDDMKGSALVVFVTLKSGVAPSPELREELRQHVGNEIGPVAKPDEIRFAEALPKTRSGKIMRRLLKQIAAGTEIRGDMTTLEDFNVLSRLQEDA